MNSTELTHLIVSWVTLSLAFTFYSYAFGFTALAQLPVMLLAVGTAFILHELAHKYVAIHYNAHAEFRMWELGLLLAVFFAVFRDLGLFFAAPGAVYVFGPHLSRKQHGHVSIAGPATNFVLGLAFLYFGMVFPGLRWVLLPLSKINFFLGAFNMAPFPPLDGSKVMAWNPLVWGLSFALFWGAVFFI